jgi:hypothetical protein
VYIFAVKHGKRYRPLYVGKAAKQAISTRLRQHVNGGKFQEIVARFKGAFCLFLIARVGAGRKSNTAIADLEWEFINEAFAVNAHLENERGYDEPPYIIQGFGPGRKSAAVNELSKMLRY